MSLIKVNLLVIPKTNILKITNKWQNYKIFVVSECKFKTNQITLKKTLISLTFILKLLFMVKNSIV